MNRYRERNITVDDTTRNKLIFKLSNKEVGFATFGINENEFYVHTIFVDIEYRNRGIGKIILKRLIEYAFVDTGIESIKLEDQT